MNKSTAHAAARSAPVQLVARLGMIAYGLVHLLVAWLALQIAFGDLDGDGVGKADKTGALQSIASNTGGVVLLWLIAVGLGVSALWQLFEALAGRHSNRHSTVHRAVNIGEALLFGYLCYIAAKLASGKPGSSTDQTQLGLIGGLLAKSWGKPVVILLGVAVVLAGLLVARHGLTKQFASEHDYGGAGRPVRTTVIRLGQIGYAALGSVYAIAGALVVVAAVQSQPQKATGLDVALKTLAAQSYGSTLLALVALGLAAFAVFSFFDARYRRAG